MIDSFLCINYYEVKNMQISIETLNSKNKYNTLNIIDIRNANLYAKGHIINAKNIPEYLLVNNPEQYLNKKETYYIYCQTGTTSRKVVSILNSRGYHVFDIIGGYKNYLLWK